VLAAAADADVSERWQEMARRHLAWSRWASRRDEWAAWQGVQPAGEAPAEGPWALVHRTATHPQYKDQYESLPSHLPGWARSKKQRPPRWSQENNVAPRMVGVDCEMCETDQDPRALVGVSVVDEDGGVLLKELVLPPGKIVDLKTDITGLTLSDLATVTTTLEDVQATP